MPSVFFEEMMKKLSGGIDNAINAFILSCQPTFQRNSITEQSKAKPRIGKAQRRNPRADREERTTLFFRVSLVN